MRREPERLFTQFDLRAAIDEKEKEVQSLVDRINPGQLLNASLDDLREGIVEDLRIAPIRLLEDQTSVDEAEVEIDVSRDPNRYISNRNQPFHLKGTEVSFFIPFEGDPQLFGAQSATIFGYTPRGNVEDGCLVLRYRTTDHDAEAIKKEFGQDMVHVRGCVQGIQQMLDGYNKGLPGRVRQSIEARRSRLLKDRGLVASIGFPMRKRADAPATYTVPNVRRKVSPVRASHEVTRDFVPEPTLDLAVYEEILAILRSMVLVMERSPSAFQDMDEEAIRTIFLVTLNGQFEGQATGETFNAGGKTDILIRHEDRNVFIAECKFWTGPQGFRDAVGQLLGYATWRDGKLALLVFNRNKNFSDVLTKIRDEIQTHPSYKAGIRASDDGTEVRCTVRHPNDKDRELTLTVLAFDVPVGD